MNPTRRWLPIGIGASAYLGVAPLRCAAHRSCSGYVAWDGNTHLNAAIFGISIGVAAWLIVLTANHWDRIGAPGRVVARTLLLAATLLCLVSIGGAMLVGFPVLAPLIVLVIRSSHPATAVTWTILGVLAAAEVSFMYPYVFPGGVPLLLVMTGVVVGVTAMVLGVSHSVKQRRARMTLSA